MHPASNDLRRRRASGGELLGPELVPNAGGPFVDTTGIGATGATISVVDGELRILSANTFDRARWAVVTELGETYRFTINVRKGATGTEQHFRQNGWALATRTEVDDLSLEAFSQDIEATDTSGEVRVYASDAITIAGAETFVESISLKKIL